MLRTGALQHHLKLGHVRVGQGFTRDCPPGLEPLPPGRERSDTGLDAIGDHENLVHGEQGGQFRLVGLELLPSGPDRRLLVRRVLELNHTQRQTVDEQHDVRPPGVPFLRNGELIDSQPVIVVRVLEVDDTDLRPADPRRCPRGIPPSHPLPPVSDGRCGCESPESAPSGRVSLRNASASATGRNLGVEDG